MLFFCRYTSSQVYRLRQGFQAQTSPDGTSSTSFRWEAVPMSQMSEALLSLRILQSAHQPPFLLLQALPRLTCLSVVPNRLTSLYAQTIPHQPYKFVVVVLYMKPCLVIFFNEKVKKKRALIFFLSFFHKKFTCTMSDRSSIVRLAFF